MPTAATAGTLVSISSKVPLLDAGDYKHFVADQRIREALIATVVAMMCCVYPARNAMELRAVAR